jgi:hypothetical protein
MGADDPQDRSSMLPPEAGEPPRPTVTPEMPQKRKEVEYVYEYVDDDVPSSAGDRNEYASCLPVLGGMIGCLVLIFAMFAGLLLVTGMTISAFLDSLGNIDLPDFLDTPGEVRVPEDIVLPDIEPVRLLSDLTTAEYQYADVVTSQVDMPRALATLYGDSLVLIAVVEIEAGIDMSQITEDDFLYDAETDTLTVTLPPATLLQCRFDDSKSQVVTRDTGLFRDDPFTELERSARTFATEQFATRALEEGILQTASDEAALVVEQFLNLSMSDVTIETVITPPDPDIPLPESCQDVLSDIRTPTETPSGTGN